MQLAWLISRIYAVWLNRNDTYQLNIFRQTLAMLQCVKCSFSDFRHDMANSVNALNITVEYLNTFIDTEGDSDTAEIIEASLAQLKEMKRALVPLQQYDSPPPFTLRNEKVAPMLSGILAEVQDELKVRLNCPVLLILKWIQYIRTGKRLSRR